ncbi:MAG TPA: AAA family ATPase, partial [Candidatus Dormibacteraeota bacterium]|nr:AAA family ATPase [Candidatus Dormibacteraeota bacterium]
MLALYHGGQASRALVAYEELRALVSDELGADPSLETQTLHQRILRGEVESPRTPGPSTSLDTGKVVGRDAELILLRSAWARAEGSGPGFVLIVGEAGAGKTHLASALAAELGRAGALVLTASSYGVERSLFLEPVLNAIRPALVGAEGVLALTQLPTSMRTTLVGLMPDMAPLLGEEGPNRLSPEEERTRAINAVVAVIAALARHRRVLLYIDDLHNSGPSTLEFLHVLTRRGGVMPLLILATGRGESRGALEAALQFTSVVDVGPLAPQAIASLAQAAGLPEPPGQLAAVTGGNALYVVEALRVMRDSGLADIPETLRNAIRHRVDGAGAELAEFLRAASVVGPSFDLASVEALLGPTAAARASRLGEDALRRKILVESGIEYQFAHELIRETLYDSIPGPSRAAWHGRAAAIKQARGGPPQVVGYHAARAGDHALAHRSYLAAAERASKSFSHGEAEEMLSHALVAVERLGDQSSRAEILVRRAAIRMIRGDHDLAEADLVEALTQARQAGDTTMEARAEEQRGWNAYFRRDLPTAVDRVADATALPGHGVGTNLLAARVHHALGHVVLAQESARSALTAAQEGGNPADEARALSYLGSVEAHLDSYQHAIDHSARAAVLARRAALFHPTLNSLFFGAMALGNRGDLADALALFKRLQDEGRAGDSEHYEARSLNGQSWVSREMGQLSHAADLAAEALTAASAPTMEEPRANAFYQLARTALLTGDPDRASAMLDRGRTLGVAAAFGWRYELRALDLQADILASAGQDPSEVASRLLELALSGRAPKFVALALAHLGRRSAAEKIAKQLDSNLLIARVGTAPTARIGAESLTARLEPNLRSACLAVVRTWHKRPGDRQHP